MTLHVERQIVEEDKGINVYRESLRNLILRILAEGPMHGYEIMKRIQEVTRKRWRPAAGTLYPLLSQLKNEGLVEVDTIENTNVRGGRRITYRLTQRGWRKLSEILLDKAEYKVDILIYYIIEGARLLKENGYKEEYTEICQKFTEKIKTLNETLNNKCNI